MIYLYIISGVLLFASFIADRKKTKKALLIAVKKIKQILPSFVFMLILVSAVLYFFPEDRIVKYLGSDFSAGSISIAALIGSISMIPGFIAYPLAGILRSSGVPMSVIAAFVTSLMLVGVISFPVEKFYIGTKTAVIRNIIAFLISLILSLMTGIFYGEFLI